MSWFEKLYPPTYTVRDWEETVEKNPEYADYGINYWDLWMKFRRIGDGETASEKHVHRSIQTSPCIWNEKELEVLRECRLEMKKYVKALEDNAEDQKVKIEELQRKCIAQNALITRLLRKSNGTGETLRNRKDNETSTREETCDLTKNKLQLERDMYERRAELAEEKLLSFQKELEQARSDLREANLRADRAESAKTDLENSFNSAKRELVFERRQHRITQHILKNVSRHLANRWICLQSSGSHQTENSKQDSNLWDTPDLGTVTFLPDSLETNGGAKPR
ncbi:unnamed protein product [Calicophoron daubneyi]|uniref:Uncharacterized protein n=1 Tax=Calicophoron daubneyi TaxID=300641 RepID=A0AAV2T7I3_CALDB